MRMQRGVAVRVVFLVVAFLAAGLVPASAQSQDADLAKKLNNPVASLISVPFQYNYDCCFGPSQGNRNTTNIQPVIPIKLNSDWNLISRTILPVDGWEPTTPGGSYTSGIGDITQSFFLSPERPTRDGIIWGVGPVFLLPTATNAALGSGKWGAGPTAVMLKQQDGWTVGILANHIWSFAGEADRSQVSNTFLQPFINYTFPTRSASRSTPRAPTTGSRTNGRSRSICSSAGSSSSASCQSACRPVLATMRRLLPTGRSGVFARR